MAEAFEDIFELSTPGMRFSFPVSTSISSEPEIAGNQRKFAVEYNVPIGEEFKGLLPENVSMGSPGSFRQYFPRNDYDKLKELRENTDKTIGLLIIDLNPVMITKGEAVQYTNLKNFRLARKLSVRCPVDLHKGVLEYFARFSLNKTLASDFDLFPNELSGFDLERITLRLTEEDWKRVNQARKNLKVIKDYKPEGQVRVSFEPVVVPGNDQSLYRRVEIGAKLTPEEVLSHVSVDEKRIKEYRPEIAGRLEGLSESSKFAARRAIKDYGLEMNQALEGYSPGWRGLASVAVRYREGFKNISH